MNKEVSDFNLSLPDPISELELDRRLPPKRRKLQQLGKVQIFKREMDSIGLFVLQRWSGKIAFILLVSLCLSTLFWSYSSRLGLLEQSNHSVSQLESLELELSALQDTWTSGHYKGLHQKIDNLYHQIIPGYPELATWLRRHTQNARQAGLVMNYSITAARPVKAMKNVLEVPVSITLKSDGESADNVYRSSLSFLHLLLQEPWHLDFNSIVMSSDGAGVESIEMLIYLWIHSETPLQEKPQISNNE